MAITSAGDLPDAIEHSCTTSSTATCSPAQRPLAWRPDRGVHPSPPRGCAGSDSRIGLVDAQQVIYRRERPRCPRSATRSGKWRSGSRRSSLRWAFDDGQRLAGCRCSRPAPGHALVFAATTDSVDETLSRVRSVALLVGSARCDRGGVRRVRRRQAGLRPLGELTSATERVAAHHGPRHRSRPRVTTRSDASPPASTRCLPRWQQRANGSDSSLLTLGTSCGHRSPRCARTSTCLRRPARRVDSLDPQVRDRALGRRPRRAGRARRLVDDLVQLSRGADPSAPRVHGPRNDRRRLPHARASTRARRPVRCRTVTMVGEGRRARHSLAQ